jgi:hypothetical protein
MYDYGAGQADTQSKLILDGFSWTLVVECLSVNEYSTVESFGYVDSMSDLFIYLSTLLMDLISFQNILNI